MRLPIDAAQRPAVLGRRRRRCHPPDAVPRGPAASGGPAARGDRGQWEARGDRPGPGPVAVSHARAAARQGRSGTDSPESAAADRARPCVVIGGRCRSMVRSSGIGRRGEIGNDPEDYPEHGPRLRAVPRGRAGPRMGSSTSSPNTPNRSSPPCPSRSPCPATPASLLPPPPDPCPRRHPRRAAPSSAAGGPSASRRTWATSTGVRGGGHRERGPLRRSTSDRMGGGVAGGLSARFGIDANLIRFAFVLVCDRGRDGAGRLRGGMARHPGRRVVDVDRPPGPGGPSHGQGGARATSPRSSPSSSCSPPSASASRPASSGPCRSRWVDSCSCGGVPTTRSGRI